MMQQQMGALSASLLFAQVEKDTLSHERERERASPASERAPPELSRRDRDAPIFLIFLIFFLVSFVVLKRGRRRRGRPRRARGRSRRRLPRRPRPPPLRVCIALMERGKVPLVRASSPRARETGMPDAAALQAAANLLQTNPEAQRQARHHSVYVQFRFKIPLKFR